jgi:molybdate transport system substrate-binding protein
MKPPFFFAPGLALLLSWACMAPSLRAGEVQVYAAASLSDALKEIAAAQEKASGIRMVLNLGASSTLARQIQEGAPADLFLSADEAKMDALEKQDLIEPGSRAGVLSNTLVVVVPGNSSLAVSSIEALAGKSFGRIALAEPQTVPAGIYAKTYLEKKGIWTGIAGKVLPLENVRAVLGAVESGNADAGIVYRTDALVSKKVKTALEIPASEGPAISYPFARIKTGKNPKEAAEVLAVLRSPASLEVFHRYGFPAAP